MHIIPEDLIQGYHRVVQAFSHFTVTCLSMLAQSAVEQQNRKVGTIVTLVSVQL